MDSAAPWNYKTPAFSSRHWLSDPLRTLASSRINSQTSLALTISLQPLNPSFHQIIFVIGQPSLSWLSKSPFSFWAIRKHYLHGSSFWHYFHVSTKSQFYQLLICSVPPKALLCYWAKYFSHYFPSPYRRGIFIALARFPDCRTTHHCRYHSELRLIYRITLQL